MQQKKMNEKSDAYTTLAIGGIMLDLSDDTEVSVTVNGEKKATFKINNTIHQKQVTLEDLKKKFPHIATLSNTKTKRWPHSYTIPQQQEPIIQSLEPLAEKKPNLVATFIKIRNLLPKEAMRCFLMQQDKLVWFAFAPIDNDVEKQLTNFIENLKSEKINVANFTKKFIKYKKKKATESLCKQADISVKEWKKFKKENLKKIRHDYPSLGCDTKNITFHEIDNADIKNIIESVYSQFKVNQKITVQYLNQMDKNIFATVVCNNIILKRAFFMWGTWYCENKPPRFTLFLNPTYFKDDPTFIEKYLKTVIEHEMTHVIKEHALKRRLFECFLKNHNKKNIKKLIDFHIEHIDEFEADMTPTINSDNAQPREEFCKRYSSDADIKNAITCIAKLHNLEKN